MACNEFHHVLAKWWTRSWIEDTHNGKNKAEVGCVACAEIPAVGGSCELCDEKKREESAYIKEVKLTNDEEIEIACAATATRKKGAKPKNNKLTSMERDARRQAKTEARRKRAADHARSCEKAKGRSTSGCSSYCNAR